jgi:cullin 3
MCSQDKTYVAHNKKTPVYDLGLQIFRERVVRHPLVTRRLKSLLLQNIEKERQGQLIDRPLMKATLGMLGELGVGSATVYDEEFEVILHFVSTFNL